MAHSDYLDRQVSMVLTQDREQLFSGHANIKVYSCAEVPPQLLLLAEVGVEMTDLFSRLNFCSLAVLLGWFSGLPGKTNRAYCQNPWRECCRVAQEPCAVGQGLWNLKEYVSHTEDGRSVTSPGDFCNTGLTAQVGGGCSRPKGMLNATNCDTALCYTCARSFWSLTPANLREELGSDTWCLP